MFKISTLRWAHIATCFPLCRKDELVCNSVKSLRILKELYTKPPGKPVQPKTISTSLEN